MNVVGVEIRGDERETIINPRVPLEQIWTSPRVCIKQVFVENEILVIVVSGHFKIERVGKDGYAIYNPEVEGVPERPQRLLPLLERLKAARA